MTLDDYLSEKQISNYRFAQLLGKSQAFVGYIRKGTCDPSIETCRKIMEITNGAVTPNDFANDRR